MRVINLVEDYEDDLEENEKLEEIYELDSATGDEEELTYRFITQKLLLTSKQFEPTQKHHFLEHDIQSMSRCVRLSLIMIPLKTLCLRS